MGMRITNKIMQDNSLSNINNNKILQDKLSTQMATGKKITRPSDDPVIAIRALRLRSTLSDITQYCDKNVEDAESWLKVTEDSINTMTGVLEDMYEQFNTGANEHLTTANREVILEALKELKDEIYASGDADYAGRGIFTGYRTSTKLRFQEDTTLPYEITEQVDKSVMDDITYVKMDNGTNQIGEINAGNYTDAGYEIDDTAVSRETLHRLRLSYKDLDADMVPTISYYDASSAGSDPKEIPVTVVSKYDTTQDAYQAASKMTKAGAVFIPETGEIILNEEAYKALSSTRDYASTESVDEGKISITYRKSDWKNGDLRPEHYFACTANPGTDEAIVHNGEKLNGEESQIISYDVGFNQEIRVNTLAGECYTHAIGRDLDDMISILEQVGDVEKTVNTLDGIIKDDNTSNEDRVIAEKSLAAANKALTFLEEKMQKMFENGQTRMQNHLNTTTLALTSVGTRSSKLALVKTRLSSQKTNFKDLVADNEQADTAEVATDLKSAKVAYDAALMATGKITESTLMNYI
ncbi:MAG: flagellar hook-associated protein FlgL [Lachnospiraceae bacterium]|nr:flagellar hook-associated protein FlgL [Lachnospiraceae bacterium]